MIDGAPCSHLTWLRALSLFDSLTLPNKPFVTDGHRRGFRFSLEGSVRRSLFPVGVERRLAYPAGTTAAAQRQVVGQS